MKTLLTCFVVAAALTSFTSFANPPGGVGGGQGHGNSGFGSITGGATPPGLQKKGKSSGLQMQNKTPYGWSQGKKEGWNYNHHKGYKHKYKHKYKYQDNRNNYDRDWWN